MIEASTDPFTNRPADIGIEGAGWEGFPPTQTNTLVVGEALAVTRVLTVAWTALRRPVVWCDDSHLRLPTGPVGTFIIWRLDELTAGDQQLLTRWLDGRESTRVLARSSRSVFPLVQEGAFDADLYYRLNTVLLLAS